MPLTIYRVNYINIIHNQCKPLELVLTIRLVLEYNDIMCIEPNVYFFSYIILYKLLTLLCQ